MTFFAKKAVTDAGTAVLFSCLLTGSAYAGYIPLHGGLFDYSEYILLNSGSHQDSATDEEPVNMPETLTLSYLSMSGTAATHPGSLASQTPARAEASANADDLGSVQADTDITFVARLVKLHPDAPDVVAIPLHVTGSLWATQGGLAEMNIVSEDIFLVQEQVNDGSLDVQATLGMFANDYLTAEVVANASSISQNEHATASTPVFTIDPDFTVDFLGRDTLAVDLYTLAVVPEIGFAGDFQTTTSLTDGCLPDPSILAPSGLPSVADGEAISCQALDPSGFRTYGNDPGIPSGILNDLQIVVTPGATVMTNEDGSLEEDGIATIGLLGNGNSILNQGDIKALGESSTAIYAEGDRFDLRNQGNIETGLDDSGVIYIYGDEAGVLNEGNVVSAGQLSSAIVVEGDDAFVLNEGTIDTGGAGSSGMVVEGDFATMANNGSINTAGDFSAGLVVLGSNSVSDIDNTGHIETGGDDAQGMLVIGLNHSLDNQQGSITTAGARAHGIALGLQEVVLPPGVEAPPGIFNPASGAIRNSGDITTTGVEADAIHAFAHDLQVTHSGEINTSGREAHGISVKGNNAKVNNSNQVTTTGRLAHGIDVNGDNITITNDGGIISTEGEAADAIRSSGAQTNISNAPGADLRVLGEGSAAINVVSAEQATVINHGSIIAEGPASGDNYGIKANFSGAAGNRSITNLGTIRAAGLLGSRAIDASGDDLVIRNGQNGVGGTSITVESGLGTGISVSGKNPHVSNTAPINVTGDLISGIEVTAEPGGGFLVENASNITLTGNGGTAMSLAGAGLQSPPASSFSSSECLETPGGRNLVNCNTITLVGNSLTGMSIASTADATVDNQILIFGSGDDLRGISASATTDTIISNFDRIHLDGSNATGIEIKGDGNTVLSGSGDTLFPSGFHIHSFLDFVTSDDDPGTGTRTGDITITGDNATAIVVEGNNNRIGLRAYGQVVASGSNAVAVKMSGDNNMLVNDGVLVGTGTAVQGSAGSETVLNDGAINGAVNLMAGEDTMIITDWTTQVGVVDGGDHIDTLHVVVPRPGLEDPVSIISRVDGQEYINFENVIKEGQGVMTLVGNLATSDTQVKEGQLLIENGVLLETISATVEGTASTPEGQSWIAIESGGTLVAGGNINLNEHGILALATDATAVATEVLVNDGSILYGKGRVIGDVRARGGQVLPGTSTGLLTIEGDLMLEEGMLVMEASSLLDKDTLVVEGDVTLSGGYIDVILGFTPEPGDLIELLIIDSILSISETFGGIRGFAAQGAGVALGTEFSVLIGDAVLQGQVTSVVPLPPGLILFSSALLGLAIASRRRNQVTSASSMELSTPV